MIGALLLVLVNLFAGPSIDPILYEGHAVVTGTDLRGRPAGLAQCLTEVLVKVSGEPRLETDPRVAAMGPDAPAMILDFEYRDRMTGIAHHDEQGSYDRPFDLTARFDRMAIRAALERLGQAPRPGGHLAIPLSIRVRTRDGRDYRLGAAPPQDRGRDETDQLASLHDAADRYGILIVPLPDAPPTLPLLMEGDLTWSDSALGWIGHWSLQVDSRHYDWHVEGVGFDEAFRHMARGVLRVVSGHDGPE